MVSLRTPLALSAAGLALTGGAVLLGAASAAPASAEDVRSVVIAHGLSIQFSGGYLGAEGPAALVESASRDLHEIGIDNTALFTGAGETGTGFLVVSGGHVAEGTDFQVMNMTAASVHNASDAQDAVYSDGGGLDAVVPAGASADIKPVDVDYAAYPDGSTPPPDNRGLHPTAQFTF
jgi:hypothetical protein